MIGLTLTNDSLNIIPEKGSRGAWTKECSPLPPVGVLTEVYRISYRQSIEFWRKTYINICIVIYIVIHKLRSCVVIIVLRIVFFGNESVLGILYPFYRLFFAQLCS